MDCRAFESLLSRWLGGQLGAAERAAADAHHAACAACREIAELVRTEPAADELAPPPSLLAGVLQRTVGSTCARAQELLPEAVDGTLEPVGGELVARHVDRCPTCAALWRVHARMVAELPALAVLEPDERFCADVLRATIPATRRAARRWAGVVEGARRLLERPRIAWESAYLGTLVLAAVFLAPGSPLASLPQRMVALTRVNPVERLEVPAEELGVWMARETREVWQGTRAELRGAAAEALGRLRAEAGTLWARLASEEATAASGREAGAERDERDGREGETR